MDEELLHNLPAEYAALADRRRVMLEVADELAELHGAANRLGDALERAGLPGREWRSQDASLRLISRKLPDVTVDRFITRLSEFAAGSGPHWLHGDGEDLERFHREVQALHHLAASLGNIVGQRAKVNDRPQRQWAIERAFGDAPALAALDHVVEILDDFLVLRPFMAPLAPDEWGERTNLAIGADLVADPDLFGRHDTLPPPASQGHKRLRDYARATQRPASHDGSKDPIVALLVRIQSRLAPVIRRKPVAAIALVCILVAAFAVLALHRPGTSGNAINGSQSTSLTPSASAAHNAIPAVATSRPGTRPTATTSSPPAPQLSLSCKVNSQGSSATLSIKNSGETPTTWQATGNRGITVAPTQGQLSAGQTATALVTPSSRHGWTNSAVTVTATSGGRSASYTATCA